LTPVILSDTDNAVLKNAFMWFQMTTM